MFEIHKNHERERLESGRKRHDLQQQNKELEQEMVTMHDNYEGERLKLRRIQAKGNTIKQQDKAREQIRRQCQREDGKQMIIYVQTAPDETVRFQVMSNDTAEDLKNKIQNKMAIPPEEQSHIFAGKVLLQGTTLSDFNIQNNYTLLLVTKLGQPMARYIQLVTHLSAKNTIQT